MLFLSKKNIIYIILPFLIWIMMWLTCAWIDFPRVISILSKYLTPDGHIAYPMVAFIKVLCAPACIALPLIFIWWTLNNYWKKTSKKNFNNNFYMEVSCVNNKKGLFYAKFFEFEEFSIAPFFLGSI